MAVGRRQPPNRPSQSLLESSLKALARELTRLWEYIEQGYSGLSAPHATTHLPSGADPITLGTPVSIGMTNSQGSAESLADSAHVHATPLTTKGDLLTVASSALARVGVGTDTQVLTADSAQTAGIKWAAATAAMSQSFVTTASEASLSGERVLTGTANQVIVADNGANSTVVLSTPQNIHTAATPSFSRVLVGDGTAGAPSLAFTSDDDATGTGIYRSAANTIDLATNGVDRWQVTSAGHLLAVTDNTFDIGASAATRPRNLYVGTNIILPNLGQIRFRDSGGTERLTLDYDGTDNIRLRNQVVNSNVYVGVVGAGTGKVIFQTQQTDRWQVQDTGDFVPSSDNTRDIGVGSLRPRTIRAAVSTIIQTASNAALWTNGYNTELVTIAAAATSDSAANLLPADAIIEAVLIRVTVAPPGTATFNLGDATTAARFATGVSTTINTTNVSIDQWLGSVATNGAGPTQAAAAKVRITPNANPTDATGRIRVTVFFRSFTPPTS